MDGIPSSPGCSTGSPSWSGGWTAPPPADRAAEWAAEWAADPALLRGIAAYRRHPWQRRQDDPPARWTEGGARLLDYGQAADPAILFVPSLVNRAYILDLMPDRSMLRWLARHGVRPLLLDWGWPDETERRFTLTDLVAGRLERAIAAVGAPVLLAGYCMGGLLALAAALRRPDRVRGLALLATPWDFHAEAGAKAGAEAERLAAALPLLEPLLAFNGALPVDALQTLFAAVEPGSVARKFRRFGTLDPASDAATRFVALEDWLNDGVPLAAPVARAVLTDWYGANQPATGRWCIAGQAVDPAALTMPCFAAIPARDRIVPPASALALAAAIPGAEVHRPGSGHIGMAAGPRAESELWVPLLDWLHRA